MRILFLILAFTLFNNYYGQSNFSTYYDQAVEYINTGEFEKGIGKLDKAISNKESATNNYKVTDAYLYRGYCKYRLKNYSSALSDIDEGLKLKPEYSKCYSFKAMVYSAMGEFDKCLEWSNRGLKNNSSNEELLMYKSEALYNQKKFTDSREVLAQLLQIDPKNTTAIRLTASSFQRQHNWDSSIVYFTKAIEINPLDYISYFDRGIDKSEMKDYEGAKTDIEKAMKLDTASKFIGFNNLGFFLKLEQNDYLGAIECFDKAIKHAPRFAYAYSNRGFAKLCLGDVNGAYIDVKRSLELDNSNSYAHKNMGLVNLKRGRKKEACENFKTALEKGYTEMYDDAVEKLLKENCN